MATDPLDDPDNTVWLNIQVFSQILVMPYPRGFESAYEGLKAGMFIQEFVPKGQTVDNWTEMFTITGERDRAVKGDLSPVDVTNGKGGLFERNCPDTFAGTRFRDVPLGPYPADVVVLSCGNVLKTPPGKSPAKGYSESAIIIAIQGERDIYTIQWAQRAKPSRKPPQIDIGTWSDRMSKMIPIKLCPAVQKRSQSLTCTPG